jgi:hypothetical protein
LAGHKNISRDREKDVKIFLSKREEVGVVTAEEREVMMLKGREKTDMIAKEEKWKSDDDIDKRHADG